MKIQPDPINIGRALDTMVYFYGKDDLAQKKETVTKKTGPIIIQSAQIERKRLSHKESINESSKDAEIAMTPHNVSVDVIKNFKNNNIEVGSQNVMGET